MLLQALNLFPPMWETNHPKGQISKMELTQTQKDNLLIESARKGDLKGVKYWVKNGANVRARNDWILQEARYRPGSISSSIEKYVAVKSGFKIQVKMCLERPFRLCSTRHDSDGDEYDGYDDIGNFC